MVKLDDETRDDLGQQFGISYTVKNSSAPHRVVVEERFIPKDCVNLVVRAGFLRVRIEAHAAETKGNSVQIDVPVEGMKLIINEIERGRLERELEAKLEKRR